jgi:hypothetical protein
MSDFIFPPFAPVPPRPAAASAQPAAPAPAATAETPAPAPSEPEAAMAPVAEAESPHGVETVAGPEDAVGASGRGPLEGFGGSAEAEEEALPWEASSFGGEGEDEDLPWLEVPSRGPVEDTAPAAQAEVAAPVEEEPDTGDVPDWMAWGGAEVGEAPAAGMTESPELPSPGMGAGAVARAEAPEAEAPAAVADLDTFERGGFEMDAGVGVVEGLAPVGDLTFPEAVPASSRYAPEPEPEEPVWESPAAAASHAAPAEPAEGGMAALLGPVADRLEAIARDLRQHPETVLSGAHAQDGDALALLVTGFVLGYTQRGGGR